MLHKIRAPAIAAAPSSVGGTRAARRARRLGAGTARRIRSSYRSVSQIWLSAATTERRLRRRGGVAAPTPHEADRDDSPFIVVPRSVEEAVRIDGHRGQLATVVRVAVGFRAGHALPPELAWPKIHRRDAAYPHVFAGHCTITRAQRRQPGPAGPGPVRRGARWRVRYDMAYLLCPGRRSNPFHARFGCYVSAWSSG
jgi:hypothetical protein